MLIRKLRLQRGWSQEQLARLSGLSVRTIQRVEQGYPLSLETRNALASVFGIEQSALDTQEHTMSDPNDPNKTILLSEEALAMEYVKGLKSFYQHLLFYIFIAVFFCGGIFLVHRYLPVFIQFVMVGWAFGLVFHGLNAFEILNFLGPQWEKRKIEKRLGRKL